MKKIEKTPMKIILFVIGAIFAIICVCCFLNIMILKEEKNKVPQTNFEVCDNGKSIDDEGSEIEKQELLYSTEKYGIVKESKQEFCDKEARTIL